MTFDPNNIQPGMYENVDAELYHNGTGKDWIGSSILTETKSMAHVEAKLRTSVKVTPAMRLGTVIHMACTELNLFKELVVMGPDENKNTKVWKEFVANNPGKMILNPEEYLAALTVATKVNGHPACGPLIAGGIVEPSFFWIDKETGLRLKCRPDVLSRDMMIYTELKSAQDASADGFTDVFFYRAYYARLAMYIDGMNQVLGHADRKTVLIAAEKEDPFELQPYTPQEDPRYRIDPMEVGYREYRLRIKNIAECASTGVWPGYSKRIEPLHLPDHINKREAVL